MTSFHAAHESTYCMTSRSPWRAALRWLRFWSTGLPALTAPCSLLPGTRKTTTLMETVSNCSEVTLGCLSSALNAPGVEWHSSSSSAEHCSQALISVWCCQRTSTSTPVCDSSALSVTTCWRHSKLSSYLRVNTSCLMPHNGVLLKGGVFKYQFWLNGSGLDDSWIKHLLWILQVVKKCRNDEQLNVCIQKLRFS